MVLVRVLRSWLMRRAVVPIRTMETKKQISHDAKSNIYRYKFSYSVEIIPGTCAPRACSHSRWRPSVPGGLVLRAAAPGLHDGRRHAAAACVEDLQPRQVTAKTRAGCCGC